MRPRFALLASVPALSALIAGCSGAAEASDEGGRGGGPPPAVVEVGEVTTGTLRITRTYLGQVRALARAELAAGAEGEVVEVHVREGDRVAAGDLLLRLDPGLARAALQAAVASRRQTTAQRAQAEREVERFHRAGSRTVAGVEIERAESSAEALDALDSSLRARVDEARESLDRHRVVAPFPGVIAARQVDPGDWVSAGDPVLELVADDHTEVLVRVEPTLLSDVDVGTSVTIRGAGLEVPGRVEGVVRALDPATRTAQLRVLATEEAPGLLAGATAEVEVTVERGGDGVLVPRDALVVGVAETRVFTVADEQAQPVVVDVLERGVSLVRVQADGLAPGTRIVVRGNERLRPGQPVQVDR
ncbi:MAG: efflux RND transporter periplasmic adaptor subunit [Sandaracinaceae bacterium]